MSRERTIRYSLEMVLSRGVTTPSEWRARKQGRNVSYGKPSTENLKKHCLAVEESCKPGGCNEHLGETEILSARIVNQLSGEVVATYVRD